MKKLSDLLNFESCQIRPNDFEGLIWPAGRTFLTPVLGGWWQRQAMCWGWGSLLPGQLGLSHPWPEDRQCLPSPGSRWPAAWPWCGWVTEAPVAPWWPRRVGDVLRETAEEASTCLPSCGGACLLSSGCGLVGAPVRLGGQGGRAGRAPRDAKAPLGDMQTHGEVRGTEGPPASMGALGAEHLEAAGTRAFPELWTYPHLCFVPWVCPVCVRPAGLRG